MLARVEGFWWAFSWFWELNAREAERWRVRAVSLPDAM